MLHGQSAGHPSGLIHPNRNLASAPPGGNSNPDNLQQARLAAVEPPAHHVGSDTASQVAASKRTASQVGGLAELVASREGEGVHDG